MKAQKNTKLRLIIFLAIMLAGINGNKGYGQTLLRYDDFSTLLRGSWSIGMTPCEFNNAGNGIFRLGTSFAGFNYVQRLYSDGTLQNSYYYYSSATTPYNPTLTSNADGTLIMWYFNMRQNASASQPGGLCGSSSGCATNRQGLGVVLASSVAPNGTNAGNRYVVTYGDAGDVNNNGKLQLVAVADLANYASRTVICTTPGTLSSLLTGTANGYYSVKVVYNPQTDEWSLYARYDGATSFSDPLDPSGDYTQCGATTVNNTYTGSNLSYIAFQGHYSGTNQYMEWDNFYVFCGIGNTAGTPVISTTSNAQSMAGTASILSGNYPGAGATNLKQFYEVFGTNLSANVTVTAPSGIEISTSPASGFASSLVLNRDAYNTVQAKIYVRPSTSSMATGNITHTSTGATARNVSATVVPMGAGSLTVTGVVINQNDPSQPMTVTYSSGTGGVTTMTGQWNSKNDLMANTVTTNMPNSTTSCGFSTNIRNYVAQEFQVSATGSYTFTMRTNSAYDGAGYITTGGFTPGSCASGTWIAGSDGAAAGAEPIITATLTAGVSYTLFTTTGGGAVGSYNSYNADNSFVWDVTVPAPGDQLVIPAITCENTITGNWQCNYTGGAATQIDNYARGVNSAMSNSSTCDFTTSNNRNYTTQDFMVSVDGSYTFTMANNTNYNGSGYIVAHTPQAGGIGFTFGACAAGTFIRGDDVNGEATMTNVNLTKGRLYTLVSNTSGLNNNSFSGACTWNITGTGSVMLPFYGQLLWFTTPTGGSPCGYGGSWDPVGVPCSGLPNTATAGTWTYYVAFSSYPDVRTPVTYVINASSCTPPLVTAEPVAATICEGADTSFALTATGTGISFQWQEYAGVSFANIIDGGVYSGANNDTLSLTNVPFSMNGYIYRCVVTGGCTPNDTSETVLLTVNPLPTAYNVTGGGAYCSGDTAVNVGLSNSETGINYQLLYAGSPLWAAVGGTTGNPIDFGVQTQAGAYTVQATNATTGCQNTMTGSAAVSIYNCPPSKVSVAINITGAAADTAAILDISSTEGGILLPRMTNTGRDNIVSPDPGLLVYNTDSKKLNFYYNGWNEISSSSIPGSTGAIAINYGTAINTTGANPAASAMLDVSSTVKGLLIPRTLPGAIYGAKEGSVIFNIYTNKINYYTGAVWIELSRTQVSTPPGAGSPSVSGCAMNLSNANPAASAVLDVSAQNKALLIPRLTDGQRNNISPATGLIIYNSDAGEVQYWDGVVWMRMQ